METIQALKDKHKVPSTEKLNEFIRTGFPRLQDNLKYKEQHLLELNIKLQELKSKISTLEESLNIEEHNLRGKNNECVLVSNNLKELEVDRNKLLSEIHQLESRRNSLKNTKPNRRDQETLEHGKKKYDIYKQLTGIRWDYGVPKGTIKGYVTNGKDHTHTFNYREKESESSNLEDELWKQVARGTGRLELLESSCNEKNVPND